MSTIRNRMWLTDDVLCIEIPREELENYAKITMELTGEPGMFQLTTACHGGFVWTGILIQSREFLLEHLERLLKNEAVDQLLKEFGIDRMQ